MLENLTTLVAIIEQVIENYNDKINNLYSVNNSSVVLYKNEIDSLREDYKNITDIDNSIFEKILIESGIAEYEIKRIISNLSIIKLLIESNKNGKTTYKLSNNQLGYIEILLNKVEEIEQKNEKKINDSEIVEKLYKLKIAKYKKLFDECSVDNSVKRDILINIMIYNKEVFKRLLKDNSLTPRIKKLRLDDVISLFNNYGYDFNELNSKNQDNILNYADLSNMEELFECLEEYKFPKFDLKINGKKLVSILINCDREVFIDTVEYSKTKGISPRDLLFIIPALIEQTSRSGKGKKGGPPNDDSPIISGRSIDYKKNVEFLEKIGFRIDYIYNNDDTDCQTNCQFSEYILNIYLENKKYFFH